MNESVSPSGEGSQRSSTVSMKRANRVQRVQIWFLLPVLHFQIWAGFPVVRSPLVRSKQYPRHNVSFVKGYVGRERLTRLAKSNSVAVSVHPLLSREIVVALPYLHSDAVLRV